ncbi:MAG TPA: hypothetical protein VGH28_17135 [Polyangiaceae bacterium]|jgi:hypothetical protein
MASSRPATWLWAAALVVLSFGTRLPALLDAAATNSDAAVVGLQARHILHGEWSPFLWGSGYQTSADSTWAAVLFRVFGPTPLVLMLSALALHVGLTVCVFYMLRRRMDAPAAFVGSLPLVFTTACVHSYALYPPREMSLFLAFAAFLALDSDGLVALAAGGALAVLAVVADPYASIFVPAAFVLGLFAILRAPARLRAMGAFFGGAALASVALAWLLARPDGKHGVASMGLHVAGHNAKLLWHECLPWAIGTKIFAPVHVMDYAEWKMPRAYAAFAYFGATTLAIALVASAILAVRRPSRLALVGWLTIVLNIGGFFFSLMVMDQFSMRYLAASVLVLPLVLAPLVAQLGALRAAAALAPYLAVAGAAGWIAHGPIRRDAGVVEAHVLDALEKRHVEAATADYWAAYRLDFLWREAIPVVPYHAEQDRYPPYRARFDAAKRVAYIHDRDRSFEDEKVGEAEIARGGVIADRFTWDGFEVVVIDR